MAEVSIRYRILKACLGRSWVAPIGVCGRGLDPLQDSERSGDFSPGTQLHICGRGLDPLQDSESVKSDRTNEYYEVSGRGLDPLQDSESRTLIRRQNKIRSGRGLDPLQDSESWRRIPI